MSSSSSSRSRISMLRTARPAALRGTALVWIDLNTTDNARVVAALPTFRALRRYAEKIVIISHRGRPNPLRPDPRLSLRRDAATLSKLFRAPVIFIPGTNIIRIKKAIEHAPARSVLLLENIRFFKGEKESSQPFAHKLASLGDYFVNEAFSVCHHGSASMSVLPRLLPSFAGYELEKEIEVLSRIRRAPKHPLMLIVGGAKADDKVGVLNEYASKADVILAGGAPANTLQYLRGDTVGASLREHDPLLLRKFKKILQQKNILLPIDGKWSGRIGTGRILDIGPKTVRQFVEVIAAARTILWAGPLGMIEKPAYRRGTLTVARAIAHNRRAFSVTGGGETLAFLTKYDLEKKFGFVSMGGGALLDFLAGEKLPGIEALNHSPRR